MCGWWGMPQPGWKKVRAGVLQDGVGTGFNFNATKSVKRAPLRPQAPPEWMASPTHKGRKKEAQDTSPEWMNPRAPRSAGRTRASMDSTPDWMSGQPRDPGRQSEASDTGPEWLTESQSPTKDPTSPNGRRRPPQTLGATKSESNPEWMPPQQRHGRTAAKNDVTPAWMEGRPAKDPRRVHVHARPDTNPAWMGGTPLENDGMPPELMELESMLSQFSVDHDVETAKHRRAASQAAADWTLGPERGNNSNNRGRGGEKPHQRSTALW